MRFNRRIENSAQVFGVVYIFSGAVLLALAPLLRDWSSLGTATFSLFIGVACWHRGCERAEQPHRAGPGSQL